MYSIRTFVVGFLSIFLLAQCKEAPKTQPKILNPRIEINLKSYNKANWIFSYLPFQNISSASEYKIDGVCTASGIRFYPNLATDDLSTISLTFNNNLCQNSLYGGKQTVQAYLDQSKSRIYEKSDSIIIRPGTTVYYSLASDQTGGQSLMMGCFENAKENYCIGFGYFIYNSELKSQHLIFLKTFFESVSIKKLDQSFPEYPPCK